MSKTARSSRKKDTPLRDDLFQKISNSLRVIGGNYQYGFYAYCHKRDRSRWGLLEAVDYRDALKHLGKAFRIKKTWLSEFEFRKKQDGDLGIIEEIVSTVLRMQLDKKI